MNRIAILLSIFVIIILLSLVFIMAPSSYVREGFEPTVYNVINFTQDSCPHCITFLPQWNSFKCSVTNWLKSDGKNKNIEIKFSEAKTGADTALYSKYSVTGTPTVIVTDAAGKVLSQFANFAQTCQGLTEWMSGVVSDLPRDLSCAANCNPLA
jgi:thioredoxin-related protein